ncbi:MAG TPA: hypothetical protein VKD71_14740, partial [Gemmataceae bacterium]|nr:hypothetical protein [Gemmataceae bacterium]
PPLGSGRRYPQPRDHQGPQRCSSDGRRCRPPEVSFPAPKELTDTKLLKLTGGETLAITAKAGTYVVKKE